MRQRLADLLLALCWRLADAASVRGVRHDEDDLPKLADLRGIAPDATGDLSSEEFVRGLRDEWSATPPQGGSEQ